MTASAAKRLEQGCELVWNLFIYIIFQFYLQLFLVREQGHYRNTPKYVRHQYFYLDNATTWKRFWHFLVI